MTVDVIEAALSQYLTGSNSFSDCRGYRSSPIPILDGGSIVYVTVEVTVGTFVAENDSCISQLFAAVTVERFQRTNR